MIGEGTIDRFAPRMLDRLLRSEAAPPVRLELPDGCVVGVPPQRSLGSIALEDRGALLRLLADPELQFGELYTEGRLRVDGDLPDLLTELFRSDAGARSPARLLPRRWIERALRNDPGTARASASHHYDVGNDFYALWLDERMVYTCAYFPSPDDTLEDAQVAKMDHVCRKLALRPDERVVEAGCGWGSLALHMARYYGVRVRAFNVSHEQVAYARGQAEKQGLQDRVEFVEDDYRSITGRYDAFVSVGMLEHVGLACYDELGCVIERSLSPDGRGFLHTIGRTRPCRLHRWIERRVFPNAHPPTLGQMMDILEPHNLVVLDTENLRRHYDLTCRHWYDRFQRNRTRIVKLVGESKARTWELYLAGSVAAFRTGRLQLFQVLFTRSGNDSIPWHRGHVYPNGGAGGDV